MYHVSVVTVPLYEVIMVLWECAVVMKFTTWSLSYYVIEVILYGEYFLSDLIDVEVLC